MHIMIFFVVEGGGHYLLLRYWISRHELTVVQPRGIKVAMPRDHPMISNIEGGGSAPMGDDGSILWVASPEKRPRPQNDV